MRSTDWPVALGDDTSKDLAERIAGIDGVDVNGVYMRHAAPNRDAFAGGYGARWGDSFPVIYLGKAARQLHRGGLSPSR